MPTTKVAAVMGNDVSTDIIYPGRFMATVLPAETPQFAFADNAELNGKLKRKEIPPGSAIVVPMKPEGRTSRLRWYSGSFLLGGLASGLVLLLVD